MNQVLLRCSNCGAAQQDLGECQTCRSAEVRYFCANHSPGRWLEGPVCADCGARFGAIDTPQAPEAEPERAPTRAETSQNQAALAALEEQSGKHELLLKALLTHLAVTSPDTIGALIGGLTRSDGVSSQVAEQVTQIVEDVAASLRE